MVESSTFSKRAPVSGVEKVVEEPAAPGARHVVTVLGRRPQEAERSPHPRFSLRPRDVTRFDSDRVGSEREPRRPDAGEGLGGRTIGHEAGHRIGEVPEVAKGALGEGVEEGGLVGRGNVADPTGGCGDHGRCAGRSL